MHWRAGKKWKGIVSLCYRISIKRLAGNTTPCTSNLLNLKGVSKRSAFVVDKEGNIQYAEVLENAGEIPNFDAIKEVLKALN